MRKQFLAIMLAVCAAACAGTRSEQPRKYSECFKDLVGASSGDVNMAAVNGAQFSRVCSVKAALTP